jgi:hypothetical protein
MSVRLIVENDGGSLEVIIEDPSQADFDFIGRVAANFDAVLVGGRRRGPITGDVYTPPRQSGGGGE